MPKFNTSPYHNQPYPLIKSSRAHSIVHNDDAHRPTTHSLLRPPNRNLDLPRAGAREHAPRGARAQQARAHEPGEARLVPGATAAHDADPLLRGTLLLMSPDAVHDFVLRIEAHGGVEPRLCAERGDHGGRGRGQEVLRRVRHWRGVQYGRQGAIVRRRISCGVLRAEVSTLGFRRRR